MNDDELDRMKKLLQQALPPVGESAAPERDLWPAMLKRLDAKSSPPWFDWALLGGLVTVVAIFPAWIPVLLYYL